MADYHRYPMWKYKEGESPRLILTHVEEVELGDSWFEKPDMSNHTFDAEAAAKSSVPPGYEAKEYPKWRYSPDHPGGRVVNSENEENSLPNGDWYDKPDFTNHGEDSTDTSTLTNRADPKRPPFNAIGGPNTLTPVPEMKQGKAATKASNIATMKEDGGDDAESDDEPDTDSEGGVAPLLEDQAGTTQNNFDQANGVNPGDAVPQGENENGSTGKITKSETEKQTAQETKKIPVKGKSKDADDLI